MEGAACCCLAGAVTVAVGCETKLERGALPRGGAATELVGATLSAPKTAEEGLEALPDGFGAGSSPPPNIEMEVFPPGGACNLVEERSEEKYCFIRPSGNSIIR